MLKQFYKYNSLGNDFILFDWLAKKPSEIKKIISHKNWSAQVVKMCDRNFGIGADGILIIKLWKDNKVETLIFNSDGSQAERCLNGARCVAYYLVNQKRYAKKLQMMMGTKIAEFTVNNDLVIGNVGKVRSTGLYQLKVQNNIIEGCALDAGNPHFVIHQKQTPEWLVLHGENISSHRYFPNKTNVEFVWRDKKNRQKPVYNILVYERGVGITLACGTGAAAVLWLLYQLAEIKKNQEVILKMPGGELQSYVDNDLNIIQKGKANFIYQGIIV